MELDRRRFLGLGAGVAAAAALAACSSGDTSSATSTSTRRSAASLPAGRDAPFDHVVLLMMENRSFDHLLGWVPGADGRQAGLRYPDKAGKLYDTWDLGHEYQPCNYLDPQHQWEAARTQLNGGKVDGFLVTQVEHEEQTTPSDLWPISYYRKPAVPILGHLAEQYTLLDRYFAAFNGGTWPNRLYQVAAATDIDATGIILPDGTSIPESNIQTTIWDRLRDAGLTGGYYAYGEEMTKVFASRRYDAITHPVEDFFTACEQGKLPNLTLVEPDFTSASEAAGTSNDYHPYGSVRAGEAYRRARRIVDPIATTMNGTITIGCIDSVHSRSRAAKNSAVYGGGSAASARLADDPQIPITQHESPAIMPKPTDINIGPSAFNADPNENRLVRKCQPKTDSKIPPKITQVVGCVNAAAIPIRNSAVRAPQDVRASCRNGMVRHSRNRTVALSR